MRVANVCRVHLGLEKLVIKVYLEEKVHLDLM